MCSTISILKSEFKLWTLLSLCLLIHNQNKIKTFITERSCAAPLNSHKQESIFITTKSCCVPLNSETMQLYIGYVNTTWMTHKPHATLINASNADILVYQIEIDNCFAKSIESNSVYLHVCFDTMLKHGIENWNLELNIWPIVIVSLFNSVSSCILERVFSHSEGMCSDCK